MTDPPDPFWLNLNDAATKQLEIAVMLAPTLAICEALLRGEHVPLSKLDQLAATKYGKRRVA